MCRWRPGSPTMMRDLACDSAWDARQHAMKSTERLRWFRKWWNEFAAFRQERQSPRNRPPFRSGSSSMIPTSQFELTSDILAGCLRFLTGGNRGGGDVWRRDSSRSRQFCAKADKR